MDCSSPSSHAQSQTLMTECPQHSHPYEYICENCKTFLCPQCVVLHYQQEEDRIQISHIARYAKKFIVPVYSSKVEYLTQSVAVYDKAYLETEKKAILDMIQMCETTKGELKSALKSVQRLSAALNSINAKIDIAQNIESVKQGILGEQQELVKLIKMGNIKDILKVCGKCGTSLSVPVLLKLDIDSLKEVKATFSESFHSQLIQEKLSKLQLVANEITKKLNQPDVYESNPGLAFKFSGQDSGVSLFGTPVEKKKPLYAQLKQLLDQSAFNEVYKMYSELRKKGFSPSKLVSLNMIPEDALPVLLSYAIFLREHLGNGSLFGALREASAKYGTKKEPDLLKKFSQLLLPQWEEYQGVAEALHQERIRDQDRKISVLIAGAPRKAMSFSQKALDSYLNHKAAQTQFGKKLMESKFREYCDVLISLDSVLKIFHFANQFPLLKQRVDELSSHLDIPIKHMAMVRLKAFGQQRDWAGFLNYISKEKPGLPAEAYAEICIMYKHEDLAKQYIAKVKDLDERVNLYMEIDAIRQAVEDAVIGKRPELLQEIQRRSPFDINQFVKDAEDKMKKK